MVRKLPKIIPDVEITCPYCHEEAEFIDSVHVYKIRSYGMIYACRPCHAWVGVHKGTRIPLGRLANKELRQAKMAAHAAFDPLWRNAGKDRGQAYGWLSQMLGIDRKECHIGMFDVEMCNLVVEVCSDPRLVEF